MVNSLWARDIAMNTPNNRYRNAPVLGVAALCVSLFLSGCMSTTPQPQYDQNSWKTMLPDTCQSFFDGCNNCRRSPGSSVIACTRKYCDKYAKPVCLDEADEQAILKSIPARVVHYTCDKGNTFDVFYGEYISGDQKVKLNSEQIMFADRQAHTTYLLKRMHSASGIQYSDDKLVFRAKGKEAMVMRNQQQLYTRCVIKP